MVATISFGSPLVNFPVPLKSVYIPSTSASENPTAALNSSRSVRFAAMLNPLVRSSMVTGETPVMKMRSKPPLNFLNQLR